MDTADNAEIVGAEDLERELTEIRVRAAGSLPGIFGPRSITWRVDREAAIFLGAGRALLLQLAHPWVAAAIEEHSETFADPIRRFHRTFSIVFTMIFGTLDQSFAAARRLNRRHADIRGALPSTAGRFSAGSPYLANDIPALCWVHATLTDTALMAHDLVLPSLTVEERERYYDESKLFAGLFGIPRRALPANWTEFSDYVHETVQSDTLTVTAAARTMAHRLLSGADTWLPIPPSYRALTAELLPARLREAFALRYGEAEERAARGLVRSVRRLYPYLPSRLRDVGPYQEAEQRLAGRRHPDLLARLCNRVWIGRADMPKGHAHGHAA
jgi:uncharacterized protein (DUF2236 family)